MNVNFQYPITFLPCINLDETITFYKEKLGLEVALEQGQCIIFKVGISPHIGYWGFCSHYEERIKPAKRVCLTLVVNSPEEVNSQTIALKEKGIICNREPQQTPHFKIYNAFFEDPSGYTVEIQAFDADGKPKWV